MQLRKDDIKKEKVALADFLAELSMAISLTRKQIKKSGYKKSLKLKKVWLEVFKKSYSLNLDKHPDFPIWFNTKADFWERPEKYSNGESTIESVKTLDELEKVVKDIENDLDLSA